MSDKPIYIVDNEMPLDVFLEVMAKLSPPRDIEAKGVNNVIWELVRDQRLFVWFDPLAPEEGALLGVKLPEGRTTYTMTAVPKEQPPAPPETASTTHGTLE